MHVSPSIPLSVFFCKKTILSVGFVSVLCTPRARPTVRGSGAPHAQRRAGNGEGAEARIADRRWRTGGASWPVVGEEEPGVGAATGGPAGHQACIYFF